MIDIYCAGGTYYGIMISYDVMLRIMRDDFIKPDDFIEVRFEDGVKGAIQKKSITGFCESQENV